MYYKKILCKTFLFIQKNLLKSISWKKGAKKDGCTKFPENLPMSKRKQKMSQPQYSELQLQRNKTVFFESIWNWSTWVFSWTISENSC